MTFSDIFKSSFLSNVTSVSFLDMTLALVLAFGVGLFIFFVYKKTYSGVMYSSSFGVTLIALTMITTLVILAVTSNVVLSLGMVGALSIVRFRTAIKEPLDIAFLFCARGRSDSARRVRQRGHRHHPSGLCKPQGQFEPLYSGSVLRGQREREGGDRLYRRECEEVCREE